ncbi:MAG: dockerin type I repeat-containing protein [Clostridia bacterium]|nr:dockerin type I repeat-containing protein [Clostridia bacterium]
MKKALSLIVTLLLVFAAMPIGAIVSAKTVKPIVDTKAFIKNRSGMSDREQRWAGLDDESLEYAAQLSAAVDAQRNGVHAKDEYPINWDEAERLRPFYTDYIDSIVSDYLGYYCNLDRMYGMEIAYNWPDWLEDPSAWYEINNETGNCLSIPGFFGFAGGYGNFETDMLDVSGFQEIESIVLYPHYIANLNASNCPSFDRLTLTNYDNMLVLWNDAFYNQHINSWDEEHCSHSVDLSNDPSLRLVQIYESGLEEINLDGSLGDNLEELYLAYNQLSGEVPDLSNAHNLLGFAIPWNHFTGELIINSPEACMITTECIFLDSCDDSIWTIDVDPNFSTEYGANNNCLTDIRFLESKYGPLHLGTENGYVDVDMACREGGNWFDVIFAAAYPDNPDAEFVGWFDPEGNLVSTDQAICVYKNGAEGYINDPVEMIGTDLTAVFTNGSETPIEGDVDMNGTVNVTDALLALRYAMGIIELTPEQVALADVDGSGTVTVTDAVIILRMAMGII